jgi:hypothetical protein
MVHCRDWLSPSASSPPTPSAQRGNTVARLTSPGAREKLSPMVDEPENLVLRYLRAFDEKVDACARTSARSRCAWAGSRPPWRTCMSSLRSTPCASTGLPQGLTGSSGGWSSWSRPTNSPVLSVIFSVFLHRYGATVPTQLRAETVACRWFEEGDNAYSSTDAHHRTTGLNPSRR